MQTLETDLEDELGGSLLDVALALVCLPQTYEAHCIRKALVVGDGPNAHLHYEFLPPTAHMCTL
jgi:hypothetical protein